MKRLLLCVGFRIEVWRAGRLALSSALATRELLPFVGQLACIGSMLLELRQAQLFDRRGSTGQHDCIFSSGTSGTDFFKRQGHIKTYPSGKTKKRISTNELELLV